MSVEVKIFYNKNTSSFCARAIWENHYVDIQDEAFQKYLLLEPDKFTQDYYDLCVLMEILERNDPHFCNLSRSETPEEYYIQWANDVIGKRDMQLDSIPTMKLTGIYGDAFLHLEFSVGDYRLVTKTVDVEVVSSSLNNIWSLTQRDIQFTVLVALLSNKFFQNTHCRAYRVHHYEGKRTLMQWVDDDKPLCIWGSDLIGIMREITHKIEMMRDEDEDSSLSSSHLSIDSGSSTVVTPTEMFLDE